MRHSRSTCLALAALLSTGFPLTLHAQEQHAHAPSKGSVAPAPTVTIDVVVTRKGSKEPVAGLRKQDFGLLDEGQPVPSVTFREMTPGQQPVRAILVVDALNIRVTGQQYVRDQVERFLKNNEITVPTELAILTDKGVQIQQGFSTDGPGMAASLGKQPAGIRSIPQSTGVYGAAERFNLSITGLKSMIEHVAPLPGRTLVLWVSPGWPILSGPGIDLSRRQQEDIFREVIHLSTAMRQARVTLYAIDPIGAAESLIRSDYYESYLKPVTKANQTDIGDESLQVLALQSGGLYLNSSAVGEMLQQSLADTHHYYEMSFPAAPVEKPNTFRSIYVKAIDAGSVVRTRNGYYAQP